MIVLCPECGKKLRVDEDGASAKRIRCPKCSTIFVASAEDDETRDESAARKTRKRSPEPDDEEEKDEPRPRVRERGDDEEDDDDRPARRKRQARESTSEEEDDNRRPRKKKKKKKRSPVLLWGAIGGGVVFLGVAVVVVILLARGDPFSRHEAAAREMISLVKELTAAIESVKDQNSARAAAVKINQVCDRMASLQTRLRALPKITAEQDRRLEEMLKAELGPATQRMQQVGFQAGVNAAGEPTFVAAVRRLQSLRIGPR